MNAIEIGFMMMYHMLEVGIWLIHVMGNGVVGAWGLIYPCVSELSTPFLGSSISAMEMMGLCVVGNIAFHFLFSNKLSENEKNLVLLRAAEERLRIQESKFAADRTRWEEMKSMYQEDIHTLTMQAAAFKHKYLDLHTEVELFLAKQKSSNSASPKKVRWSKKVSHIGPLRRSQRLAEQQNAEQV
jgi:hypothetical protein